MQSLRTRTQQFARARPCYHFFSQPQSARNFKTSKTFFTGAFSNRLQGYNILSPLADLQQRVNISWLSRHGATVTFNQHFTTKRQDESSQGGNVQMISVTFVEKDGEEKTIEVPIGMSMLEAAHQNDIELEGACEGSLACSTCHVIMENHDYNKLPEPTDEENDMLDLAFGLTETSRLGCQVVAIPELDGMRIALPSATRNFVVDGYVPKPH